MPPRASAAPAVRRVISGRLLWFLFRSVSELNGVEQSDTRLNEKDVSQQDNARERVQPV